MENKCEVCGVDRIKIKEGLWLCPAMLGSPMHYCDNRVAAELKWQGKDWEAERLRRLGCTKEEYIEAVNKWKKKRKGEMYEVS